MASERRKTQEFVSDDLLSILDAVDVAVGEGNFARAIDMLDRATELRDLVIRGDVSTPAAVDCSTRYNESQQMMLEALVVLGDPKTAEAIAINRMRKSENPYEVSALQFWAAMHEAQKGNLGVAKILANASKQTAHEIGSPWLEVAADDILSSIHFDLGDMPAAERCITDGLRTLESAPKSTLYLPARYKKEASYGLKRRLRYHLGLRLYRQNDEAGVRHFCDQILTASPALSRRGFMHHWLGQAELPHMKPIGTGKYRDCTQAAIHLKAAEDLFVQAGEPVYAAHVVLDQGYIVGRHLVADRAAEHIRAAITEYTSSPATPFALEIDEAVQQISEARLTAFTNLN